MLRDVASLSFWIILIEFGGALVIVGHCLAALATLVRTGHSERTRFLVIQGSLWGLDFKLAATLLKTIGIHNWRDILAFAAILCLRTLIKRVLVWEQRHLGREFRRGRLSPR